jgi:hypothetical protein
MEFVFQEAQMKASSKQSVQCRLVMSLILSFGALLIASNFLACSRQTSSKNEGAKTMAEAPSAECLEAAQRLLGSDAQVARCGDRIGGSDVESIAFTRLKQFSEDPNGIPISRLVILQKVDSQWKTALDVARQIQNPAGYVGIDYIDDSQQYPGYRANFLDRRSDGQPAFVLQLSYLRTDGKSEGVPIEISWNSAAGRFQEFSANQEPEGFKTELKNPPHIHGPKS